VRSTRMRTVVTALCSVLCLLAITSSLLLFYISRILFHPQAFSHRIAASLAEPGVAALVATRITDSLIQQRRNLVAFRPIILGTTESVISSAPFRSVVQRAAKVAHGTMISQTGKDISLSVSDASVILQSALSNTPELAKKIPARATTLLGSSNEAPGGRVIVRLVRFAHNLRIGALALLIFGIVMGATAFFVTSERRRFLLRMGVALTIIALILCLTVRFGGRLLGPLANDELIGGAIAGLWHAFLTGLTTWALILGAIGLVLAAGVTSLLNRVELLAIGYAVRDWFMETHKKISIRLLQGFILLIIGFISILFPSFVLTAFAMIVGAVVFFIGMREIFSVILQAIPQTQTIQETAVASEKTSVTRIAVVTVIALLLVAAGIFFLINAGTTTAPQMINVCNGYHELCDRRFNEVVLPATHNSMSAADIPNWMFSEQERSIRQQLQDGIRGFLIDAHYGMPAGKYVKTLLEDEAAARKKYEAVLGKEGVDAAMRIRDRLVGEKEGKRNIYLCHGFCELGAEQFIPMLQQVRDFLVINPDEVITFVIQDEGVIPKDIEKSFNESGLIDFVYRGKVSSPWPTLRNMISNDQRVMVFAENNSTGVPWYHLAYEAMQETPYKFHRPDEFSCKPNRGTSSASLFLINHWIETAPAPKPSNAEIVNAYDVLLKRAQQCQRERHMLPNLLAVDFYKTGDLFRVVEALNGIKKASS
jgi:MFS family permease